MPVMFLYIFIILPSVISFGQHDPVPRAVDLQLSFKYLLSQEFTGQINASLHRLL